VKVELLYFDDCPSYERLRPRLEQLLQDTGVEQPLELLRVASEPEAVRERFLGSPTIRVDGADVEQGADARNDFGLKCRFYRGDGWQAPVPPDDWIVTAVGRARGDPA
jgi:hypothetical protein